MLLKDLHLAAFRSFVGTRLEELGRISLIVGTNNAGKSSILEAAGLILRPFDPGQWVQTALHRDANVAVIEGLWSMFPRAAALSLEDGQQQSTELHIEAVLPHFKRKLSASATVLEGFRMGSHVPTDPAFPGVYRDDAEEQTAMLRMQLSVDEGGAKPKEHHMVFQRGLQTEHGSGVRPMRSFTVTPATHRNSRALVDHLNHVVKLGRKELAITLLRLFDPRVVGLDGSRAFGNETICLTHEVRGVVDLASFGDGMRRSTAIALALARASGGVVLVDELEAGIHPRALGNVMSHLVKAAREADVQILATTHSLEAIDSVIGSVAGADAADVVGYHVRRDEDSHVVRRYDGARLARLREGGLDLR